MIAKIEIPTELAARILAAERIACDDCNVAHEQFDSGLCNAEAVHRAFAVHTALREVYHLIQDAPKT